MLRDSVSSFAYLWMVALAFDRHFIQAGFTLAA
jgi:hypothetical protein